MSVILYAEDEENDAFLMRRAFVKAEVTASLQTVSDGQQAIDYLQGASSFADRLLYPLPVLVLLDLKLPLRSGLEVLKWIRATPAVCTLPVLILTSSSQDTDVHRAYLQGANGYLVKPGTPQQLNAMVRSIQDFWLRQNQLDDPSRPPFGG